MADPSSIGCLRQAAHRKRCLQLGAAVAALALVAVGAALAASAPPRPGPYAGLSHSKVKGAQARPFTMRISHARCAPPGSTKKRTAYCATIASASLIETRCASGVVNPYYFPATEPIALSGSRSISHLYSLYHLMAGDAFDRHVPGSTKFGTFRLDLHVDASGHATGSMRYRANYGPGTGICDSRVVAISARLRK